jgi:hypothetical protein
VQHARSTYEHVRPFAPETSVNCDQNILQEKIQNFNEWFRAHTIRFPKHKCIYHSHHNFFCWLGFYLAEDVALTVVGKNIMDLNGAIDSRNLLIPTIAHEQLFVDALENGVEFCPHSKKFSQDSTNTGMSTDEEYGYSTDESDDHKPVKIQLALSDALFQEKYFDEVKFIGQYRNELTNGQEPKKKAYRQSRVPITTEIKEYKIQLINHQRIKMKS